MLVVAALQLRYPVLFFILMEAGDALLHEKLQAVTYAWANSNMTTV